MTFELPKLKYDYDALKYIDEETMKLHHTKHHAGYVNNLNKALEDHPELHEKSLENLLRDLHTLPTDIIESVKNNGGGHFNHSLFWEVMTPNQESKEPEGVLMTEITNVYRGFENFKQEFTSAAVGRFGSGWAWLSIDGDGKMYISSNANQENPVMDGCFPILGLDVWEHAYYLKYQNRRAEYVENWWNLVDWKEVERRFVEVKNA